MSFHKSVLDLVDKHGSDVTITRNGNTVFTKGFIQPLRYKTRMYKDKSLALGGFTDGRYYLYIGKPDNKFSRTDNAIISCCGKDYVVHTSETFDLHNKSLYVWAVLKPKKDNRRDDYEAD